MNSICGSSMKTPVSPTSVKSCKATMKVGGPKGFSSSPAASQESAIASSVPHDLGGCERSFSHVVLEFGFLHRGVRVLPGDHEHRVALVHQVLDQAVLRLQIEDVVLVDPGRYEHDGCLVNLFGRRLVLDQLYELVAVDDLARCDGQVLPRLERVGVSHAHAAFLQVREQVAGALGEADPPGLESPLEGRGVGQQIIDGSHGVYELLEVELETTLLGSVLTIGLLRLIEQILRGE